MQISQDPCWRFGLVWGARNATEDVPYSASGLCSVGGESAAKKGKCDRGEKGDNRRHAESANSNVAETTTSGLPALPAALTPAVALIP